MVMIIGIMFLVVAILLLLVGFKALSLQIDRYENNDDIDWLYVVFGVAMMLQSSIGFTISFNAFLNM